MIKNVFESLNPISLSAAVEPLLTGFHVAPAFMVLRIVPSNPTINPVLEYM